MRVYLSKSNLACPYLVDKVRAIILAQGHNVAEHHGNAYNQGLLLDSDVLLIVPAKEILSISAPFKGIVTGNARGYGYNLGKGQHSQIDDFLKESRKLGELKPILLLDSVVEIVPGNCKFHTAELYSLKANENGDWKVSYGFAELAAPYMNLERALQKAYTRVSINDANNKYIAGCDVFNKEADFKVHIHNVIRKEYGGKAMEFDASSGQWRVLADQEKVKDGETYQKDCFDGTPHLACALLYNL